MISDERLLQTSWIPGYKRREMSDGLSKKQLYELLKALVQTHNSVHMETDSFSHGQGRSIDLYLNDKCVTRPYFESPTEYNDLAFVFFEYFQDDYEEGFESDHIITFHLNDHGELYADREDYASSNYFGDELSIDPLVSEFKIYNPYDQFESVDLDDEELNHYLDYVLEFTVSHSSDSELLLGFKATKGRKKSPVEIPLKVLQIAQKLQVEIMDLAEKSDRILKETYSVYNQNWTLCGDIVDLERSDYSLSVHKTLSSEDVIKIFETER